MELTLTKISHFTKDKTGAVLTTSKGKPYTRCLINAQEYGSQTISGFGNATTQSWKEGDKVDLIIDEVKKGENVYLNFSLPKKDIGGTYTEADRELANRIFALLLKIENMLQFAIKPPDTEDDNLGDQPF